MKFNFFKNAIFHTSYDKAKCKEIIGACTLKGEDSGWCLHIEKDPSGMVQMEQDRRTVSILRSDRVVSILCDDRIKLYSMRSLPGDGYWSSRMPRFKWVLHFAGELQSSSEGTIIAGRIRLPTIAVLMFAFGFAPFCIFAFLGVFGLIVAVVSGYLADPPGITISDLKMPFFLTLPFLAAMLFVIHGYFQTRKECEDIFDVFMVGLKAKRRS